MTEKTAIELIKKDITHMREGFDTFSKEWKEQKKNFVTRTEFAPIKGIVWTIVILILSAVVTAGLGTIIQGCQ